MFSVSPSKIVAALVSRLDDFCPFFPYGQTFRMGISDKPLPRPGNDIFRPCTVAIPYRTDMTVLLCWHLYMVATLCSLTAKKGKHPVMESKLCSNFI